MNNYAVVLIVLLLATAGAIGAWYVLEYQPVMVKRAEYEQEKTDKENKIKQLTMLQENIAKLNKEIVGLNDEKAKLQTESIPLNLVVPKLLDSTEVIANKFNVKFQDIRISQLIRAEDWSELPVEMTILGTFKDIGNFLTIMEKRKIINLAAGTMNVSVSADVDRDTKSPLLSVVLSAKVYVL
jgi:Tfp pilus assembly protein PilO